MLAIALATAMLGAAGSAHAYHPSIPAENTYVVEGIVADEIRPGKATQWRTSLREVTLNGARFDAGAYWSFYTEALLDHLEPGQFIRVNARVYEPGIEDNEGGFNFREYLLQRGMTIGIYGINDFEILPAHFSLNGLIACVRHQLSQRLIQLMGEEAGGYASAMLLGCSYLVPTEDRAAFQRLGIGHILTVSGFHVGVLWLLALALMKLLHIGRKGRMATITILLGFYCLLTGMNPPVVRASLLLVLNEYGTLRKRRHWSVLLLTTSALILLLWSPTQLTSASFHLTYGALAGILLVTPTLQKSVVCQREWQRKLWGMFSATLGAQLGVLLPVLYWYQELPVLGILLNVPVLFVSQGLLMVYWATLALNAIPWIGVILGQFAAWLTTMLTTGTQWIAGADWLTFWTKQANWLTAIGWLTMLVAGAWIIRLTSKKRLLVASAGLAVMIISLIPLPHQSTEYIQFSVGNADAAVIHDQNQVMVIDTGEDGNALSTWLKQRRLSIDTLILTHLHSDHAGGVQALLDDRIPVKTCYLPTKVQITEADEEVQTCLTALQERGTAIQYLSRGDALSLPSGQLTVLWPEQGKIRPGTAVNSASMVLLAELNGTSLLLTGDLSGEYENYAAVEADVLKAAHHGSASSTGEAFLEKVKPSVILQSCGDATRETKLQERAGDIPVICTRSAGQITLKFMENRYILTTYHPLKVGD